MKLNKKILVLASLFSCSCGVERGVPTDTLPLSPSDETLNKKRLAVDPAGYSTGSFTFSGSSRVDTATTDFDGNFYTFFDIRYLTDSGLEYRPRALKFLPDGTIDSSYNPIESYQDSIEDFKMTTKSAFVNAGKELFLLSDKKVDRTTQSAVAGTSIIKFNSAGYVDSAFGVNGGVNSTEKGYSQIEVTDQFLYIGGKSIRRFSLTGEIDKTFAASGNQAAASGKFVVAADQSIFMEYSQRFDAAGLEDTNFSHLDLGFMAVGWEAKLNGVIYFYSGSKTAAPKLTLINPDGTLNTGYGVSGYQELTWLTGTDFNSYELSGSRLLVYRISYGVPNTAIVSYSVFNSDGSRITTFGDPDSGLCSYQLENVQHVSLLPSGKVLITGHLGDEIVTHHMGDTCVPVPVGQ